MGAKQHPIHIRGLVRLMNNIRDQLRVGIPSDHESEFRTMVRDAVRTVDNICRANHVTPQDLPAPSRRAYDYLCSVDLHDLPRPSRDQILTANSIHIAGILTTCNRYHRRLADTATAGRLPFEATSPAVQKLASALKSEADGIEGLCEDGGATPAALPVRSRRGYQWLHFLSDPHNLARHLRALSIMAKADASNPDHTAAIKIKIFPASVLYRSKIDKRSLQILVNEGFIDAPDRILNALISVMRGHTKDDEAIKAYARTEEFAAVQAAMLQTADTLSGDGKGHYHDLTAAYRRVNRTYFGGTVDAARIIWSRQPSARKLGHYDFTADTIMVSMSLDRADVPAYVVDFVVYHELLHKTMGTEVVNGRRQAHTPAFRKAERAFKHYAKAQTFLKTHPRAPR